jgi:hypothetical protein
LPGRLVFQTFGPAIKANGKTATTPAKERQKINMATLVVDPRPLASTAMIKNPTAEPNIQSAPMPLGESGSFLAVLAV